MESLSQLPSTSAACRQQLPPQAECQSPRPTKIQIEVSPREEVHVTANSYCLQRLHPKHPVRPRHVGLTVFVVALGLVAGAAVVLLIVLMARERKGGFNHHYVVVR
ncbi:hypothetical protein QR680_016745 [Steinernema hermaphroditum]|uniref:Uncharacterized protein n=1 Tax=Steinernema hermaphroditum TaxID=289476 RepID=A0AA39LN50_9BILA|nr:hypothetical protein QR680_016745 [Steinernema hermaphroditum]